MDHRARPRAPHRGRPGRTAGFTALLAAALVALLAAPAAATPTPEFTVGENPTVGVPVSFDATATICDAPPCGYTWRIFNGTRLGITFGREPVATYTFTEPGLVQIGLRVVNSNPRFGGPSPREATVTRFITVAPAPTAPVCPDLALTTQPDTRIGLPTDPCTHPGGNPNEDAGPPTAEHGHVASEVGANYYVPDAGFHGLDAIAYQVRDSVTGDVSNIATIRVLVDTAPACASLALTTPPDTPLALTGFPPCSDPDGDELTVTRSDPAHGTLADGTYTPAAGFAGTDTVAYHAVDSFGLTSGEGTLTVTVGDAPPPAAPFAPAGDGPPPPATAAAAAASTSAGDATPPAFTLRAAATAKGVRLALGADEAGVLAVTVTVNRATARRTRLAPRAKGRVRVGALKTRLGSGARVVVVRLTKHARRAVAKARRVELRVTVHMTDAAGNVARRTATVTRRR
jgi:hypothetical protein